MPPRVLAVDVGASHIAAGVFVMRKDGGLRLTEFAWEEQPAGTGIGDEWVGHSQTALIAVGKRLKFRGPILLGVPGHAVLTKFVETPAVPKRKRRATIGFEATQAIPYPIEEIVWDHAVIAEQADGLKVMLAAVKAGLMEAFCGACDAGAGPAGEVIPSWLALCRAFQFNHPGMTKPVLLVEIGARSTQLVWPEPGRFFVRTLALGGNTVTQAISDELGLEEKAAELLKLKAWSGADDAVTNPAGHEVVQRATGRFGGRLRAEINRTLAGHRRQGSAPDPESVYLAGGGSQLPELKHIIQEKLDVPVERFDALQRVELATTANEAAQFAARLAGLVGLAAPRAPKRAADWEINLLPEARRKGRVFRRREPWWLVAAACAVVAPVVPMRWFHHTAAVVRMQAAEIERKVEPMRARQRRNVQNAAELAQLQQELEILRGLDEARTSWVTLLADLQSRLGGVGDVWLDKLQARPGADGKTPTRWLVVSGRLLDREHPVSRVSPESYERVKRLLTSFSGSPQVAAVKNERFDNTQPGILRFDCTLVLDQRHPL